MNKLRNPLLLAGMLCLVLAIIPVHYAQTAPRTVLMELFDATW